MALFFLEMAWACSGGGGQARDAGHDGSGPANDGNGPQLEVDYAGQLPFEKACSVDNWCWENPLPSGHDLEDVWASGPDDVWIVGHDAMYHWDGATLSYTAIDEALHGLWAFSANDIWAVGDTVYQWDGNAWADKAENLNFTSFYSAWGAAPNDLWMVGYGGEMAHWDGSSLQLIDSGRFDDLKSVAGSSAADVWVIGEEGMLRKDQNGWPVYPFAADFLAELWFHDATHAWAVGGGGLMAKWDGSTWTRVAEGMYFGLSDVQGQALDDVWVCGSLGTLANWDGAQWASVPMPAERPLRKLSVVAPGHVWSVGDNGAVVRVRDGQLLDTPIVSKTDLYDIHGLGDSDIWAVGGDFLEGTATLHFNGTQWSNVDNDLGEWLLGVFAISSDDVWAVGEKGIIAHWDGTSWTEQSSGTTEDLYDVWASGPDDVWAVGENTTILHFDGQSWAPSDYVADESWTPYRLFGFGPDDIWAVGASGGALHRQNGAWTEVPTNSFQHLKGVWGAASDDVWAFGDSSAFRWNGTAWSETTYQFGVGGTSERAWGTGPNNIYVVSGAGTINHWNGAEWTTQALGERRLTGSIYVTGSRAWIVGGEGAIWSREL